MEKQMLIVAVSLLIGTFLYLNINMVMSLFWSLILKLINFLLVLLGEDVE